MGSEVIIVPAVFATIFGIAYLFFSSRNKERLALIEKGENASIFLKGKGFLTPVYKILLLNLAILSIGIGVAVFIANSLENVLDMSADTIYTGTIFIVGGISFLVGYFVTNKVVDK
ncbi:DUF6249 domain-containing protein [Zhouia sp. PK063]|uniref:DUF6249 domain-containing protein n=1 Tax=Zhouia sp. PK063 TaxID=3373602 RepID=UPI0037B41ECB